MDTNELMEWALIPRTMSLITAEEVRAALRRGAVAARELRKILRPMFRLGAAQRNLVLD